MPLTDIGVALQISLTYFTIIYLTGLGGLFSERSGIVNIGLEGLMIIGTVTRRVGRAVLHRHASGSGLPWGPILGLLVGAFAGLLFASIHAVATITFRVDHIVSGVVINLVAIGLARFLSQIVLRSGDAVRPGRPAPEPDRHPAAVVAAVGLGRAFQDLSPMVFVAVLMVFPVSYALYRTRWGLRLRSCGENPEASRSLGVRVSLLPLPGRAALRRVRRAVRRVPGVRGHRELARGPDARPGVHRPRRADPVELEPEAADVLRVAVRVRAGDPAAA